MAWFFSLVALGGFGAAACEDTARPPGGGPSGSGGAGPMARGPGCGLGSEPEPNDTRTTAARLAADLATAACLADGEDVDFYEITAPAGDRGGGHFRGALTDVGVGMLDVKLYSASDNAFVLRGAFTSTPGASLFFFWAASPGQTYRIAVAPFNFDRGFRYAVAATYGKVDDPLEPNDTRAQARSIAVGQAVAGFLFAGHAGANVSREEFADFYRVELGAGTVSIKLDDVPASVRPQVRLTDAGGTEVEGGTMFNNSPGGALALRTNVKAGSHVVEVGVFALPETAATGTALPAHFTAPYHLSVSQP